jgi:hypothetical protein
MHLYRILILAVIQFMIVPAPVDAQNDRVRLHGYVHDEHGEPVSLVNVVVEGTSLGTVTDDKGRYSLLIPARREVSIMVTMMGYEPVTVLLKTPDQGEIRNDFILKTGFEDIREVRVIHGRDREGSLNRIDVRPLDRLPAIGGEIENLLKTMPGVTGRNEFSSQYSVRGGNFDENLVYVNGIEIHRPQLVRSGQQEGLSFINPDLVGSVHFSAGGFSSRYGDKMSSVLDITYRQPAAFAASTSASLLGGSAHAEGVSQNGRFSNISGIRYKTNQYLLQTLDDQGDFTSSFVDFQSFSNYIITGNLKISFLGNYSRNNYGFIPTTRETSFGTFNNPLQLRVYFEGRDASVFETFTGALTGHYSPASSINLRFIVSAFTTLESETFDVRGQYHINQVERQFSNENYGDSLINIGVGTYMNHARNYLTASVMSLSHQGDARIGVNRLEWGLRLSGQKFDDRIREWYIIDSSGYNIPYNGSEIVARQLIDADNNLSLNRFSAYLQNTFRFSPWGSTAYLNAGVRTVHCSFSNNFYVSPRTSLTLHPRRYSNIVYHLSGGYYYQLPFYKELRDYTGAINHEKRPQQSVHLVTGADVYLDLWGRPFKFSSEMYYKWLYDLIPYSIDNIRIRYSDRNNARGYAAGLDMKLQGDFVRGADSWVSLSFLQTRESVELLDEDTGERKFTGNYPRPTDQLVNFALFFQDYLPNNPSYQVHLQLFYSSRLPFSAPDTPPHRMLFRMPSYRRVDLGFSKEITRSLKDPLRGNTPGNLKSLWVGAEVFNLLDIKNTVSYSWLKTISDDPAIPGEFAIPGYLSGRRLNLRIMAKF